MLKSSDVLDILVPILFNLNEARTDQCERAVTQSAVRKKTCFSLTQHTVCVSVCVCAARVGLMHIGVFILLLLSGERNFGVRLNKPYALRVPMDIPVFTGTHADLLVVVTFQFISLATSIT